MKKCPKCGKEIQDEAILCRYCHTRLDEYDKASSYLTHFLVAIENLNDQYIVNYKTEYKRIQEGLNEIKIYVDVSEAFEKLEEARVFQEEKEKHEEYLREIEKIDSTDIDTLQFLLEYLTGLGEYENAVELCRQCRERIEEKKEQLKIRQKERDYAIAERYFAGDTSQDLQRAMEMFEELADFKDAVDKYEESESKYNRLKEEEVRRKKQYKKNKTKKLCIVSAVIVCIIIIVFLNDSNNRKQTEASYQEAVLLMNEGKCDAAKEVFTELGEYKDSVSLLDICDKEIKYNQAMLDKENGAYSRAINIFEQISGYLDSAAQINDCIYKQAELYMATNRYEEAIDLYVKLREFGKIDECKYNLALEYKESGDYDAALEIFNKIIYYKDCKNQILQVEELINEREYQTALEYMADEYYYGAKEIFLQIRDYKDSAEKLNECTWKCLRYGDCVTFGSYEQDNIISNGKEKIEWIVLTVEDNKALLLSKYILDAVPYNVSNEYFAIWKTSTLRKWLNSDFYNSAFSTDERKSVLNSNIETAKYSNNYWNDVEITYTTDNVFLLSDSEVYFYDSFIGEEQVAAKMTKYALRDGDEYGFSDSYGTYFWKDEWWLRTVTGYEVDYVNSEGQQPNYGMSEDCIVGVRPAIWVDLNLITIGTKELANDSKVYKILEHIKELELCTVDVWYEEWDVSSRSNKKITAWINDDDSIQLRFEYDPLLDYEYYDDIILYAPDYTSGIQMSGNYGMGFVQTELVVDELKEGYFKFHYEMAYDTDICHNVVQPRKE